MPPGVMAAPSLSNRSLLPLTESTRSARRPEPPTSTARIVLTCVSRSLAHACSQPGHDLLGGNQEKNDQRHSRDHQPGEQRRPVGGVLAEEGGQADRDRVV